VASEQSVRRPASVTVVVVLTWFAAVVSIAGGVVALLLSAEELAAADIAEASANVYGWTSIVIGAAAALLAIGLGSGSSLARALVSLLMVARMGVGLWAIISLPEGIVAGVITIALALIVLFLLWNGKASDYFAAE
jgi:hypothetical protein